MRDGNAQPRIVLGAGEEGVLELLEGSPVAAHLLQRLHLPVEDGHDRLDVQQLACHPAGLADSPALGEKLERVESEDQVVLGAVAVDQLADLLVRRARLEPSLDG